MIDNFDDIKKLLTFDSEDDFYFCQILKRKKDNAELGSNSHVLKTIETLRPDGEKLVAILNTKNGVHLITKPFDVQAFKTMYPDIDIHKNNPTILYIP